MTRRVLFAMLAIAGLNVPPSSAQVAALPDGVDERAVTIGGPVPLPGIFTFPRGATRVPVVVLVHGSGPGDRDGTIGPNKPYRDIAHGLATMGVATLRYDKRTRVAPFWFMSKRFTVHDEVVEDALLAIELARRQPEADPRRVVLAGHSLGGMLAPRLAVADTALAGIIIMAGATDMSLPDQVDRQFAYALSLPDADTGAINRVKRALVPGMTRVRALTPADSASTELLAGAPAAYWLDLAAYSSSATMKSIRRPALVLQGERDYQVPPDQLDAWLARVGAHPGITVRRYASLNHLLMPGSGASSAAEYAVASTVDAQLIADIARWVKAL